MRAFLKHIRPRVRFLPFFVFLATIGIAFAATGVFASFCTGKSYCTQNLYIPSTSNVTERVPKAYDTSLKIFPKFWIKQEIKEQGETGYCVKGICVSDLSEPRVIFIDRSAGGENENVVFKFFIIGKTQKYHTLFASPDRTGEKVKPLDKNGKPLKKCSCDTSDDEGTINCYDWTRYDQATADPDDCYRDYNSSEGVREYDPIEGLSREKKLYNRVTKVPEFTISQLNENELRTTNGKPSLYSNYRLTNYGKLLPLPQLIEDELTNTIKQQTSSQCFTEWQIRPSKFAENTVEYSITAKGTSKLGSVGDSGTWCRLQVFSELGRPVSFFYQPGIVIMQPVAIKQFIANSGEQSGEQITILENQPFALEWQTIAAKQISLAGENITEQDNKDLNNNELFQGSVTLPGISLSGIGEILPVEQGYNYTLRADNNDRLDQNTSEKTVTVRVKNSCKALIDNAPTQARKTAMGAICTSQMFINALSNKGCGEDGSIFVKNTVGFFNCLAEYTNTIMDDNGRIQLSVRIPLVSSVVELFGGKLEIQIGNCSFADSQPLGTYCMASVLGSAGPNCIVESEAGMALDKWDACTTDKGQKKFIKGVRKGFETGFIQSAASTCTTTATLGTNEPTISAVAMSLCGIGASIFYGVYADDETVISYAEKIVKIVSIVNEGIAVYKAGMALNDVIQSFSQQVNTATSLMGFDKEAGSSYVPAIDSGGGAAAPAVSTPSAATPAAAPTSIAGEGVPASVPKGVYGPPVERNLPPRVYGPPVERNLPPRVYGPPVEGNLPPKPPPPPADTGRLPNRAETSFRQSERAGSFESPPPAKSFDPLKLPLTQTMTPSAQPVISSPQGPPILRTGPR